MFAKSLLLAGIGIAGFVILVLLDAVPHAWLSHRIELPAVGFVDTWRFGVWLIGLSVFFGTLVWLWATAARGTNAPIVTAPSVVRPPWLERVVVWVLAYPLIPLQIAFFCAISWLGFGSSLGLPDLLWESDGSMRFAIGVSLSLFFANTFTIRYMLDQRPEAPPPPSLYPDWLPQWIVILLWAPIYALRHGSLFWFARNAEIRTLGGFLLRTWIPALALLYLPKLKQGAIWLDLDPGFCLLWGLLSGVAIMMYFVYWFDAGEFLPLRLLGITNPRAQDVLQHNLVVRFITALAGVADYFSSTLANSLPTRSRKLHILVGRMIAIPSYAVALLMLAYASDGTVWPPITVLCLALAIANSIYGIVAFHFSSMQYGLLALVVVVGIACHTQHPYKLSFPGLESQPVVDPDRIPKDDPEYERLQLIRTEALLKHFHEERWAKELGQGPAAIDVRKPKLVIVANSGGGIRAAVWTAVVLEKLEEEIRGDPANKKAALRDHIRLMTGASGGMLGAGLYAADFDTPTIDRAAAGLPRLSDQLAKDSLRPTIQTLLIHDLPSIMTPWENRWDRGRSVEQAWLRNIPATGASTKSPLETTFAELRLKEAECRRPTLIFSPMLVEDCRRVLITNLDVSDVTPIRYATLNDPVPGFDPDAQSVPVLEFWRMFPKAHDQFQLRTAIRMSATFPFVGPGVSLPTSPPRRVVDAGYFDNFGINVAAVWLYENREKIREHTSGVAIIEIRAYPRRDEKLFVNPAAARNPKAGPSSPDLFAWGLSEISTPAEAIINLYARGAYFRNDLLMHNLDRYFNNTTIRQPKSEEFFTTVVFECDGDAALSWHMPDRDLEPVRKNVDKYAREIVQLREWFGDGGTRADTGHR